MQTKSSGRRQPYRELRPEFFVDTPRRQHTVRRARAAYAAHALKAHPQVASPGAQPTVRTFAAVLKLMQRARGQLRWDEPPRLSVEEGPFCPDLSFPSSWV